MKGKAPKSVNVLRAQLLASEGGLTEYVGQCVISQLGAIIERAMQERQFSQSELARAAGLHEPDLDSIVRGRIDHIPTVGTMRRLAQAMDIPLMISIETTGAVTVSQQEQPAVPS